MHSGDPGSPPAAQAIIVTLRQQEQPMRSKPEARALAVFNAVDARDAAAFAAFFAPDGVFRFGNAPPCVGRESIRGFVEAFFSALDGLEHRIDEVRTTGSGDTTSSP